MPRKIYKPEEIVTKLRQIEVLTSQGKSAIENPAAGIAAPEADTEPATLERQMRQGDVRS